MAGERIPAPNGCRHCGMDGSVHGWWPEAPVGWHEWAEPTDAQRLERMLARRAQRLAPKPVYVPTPPELLPALSVDTGPLVRALAAASEGFRDLAAARGWETAQ